MNRCISKTFPATLECLLLMLDFIRENAIDSGFNDRQLNLIELAAEEILVNIISYSYPAMSGDIEILCEPNHSPNGIQIIVIDHGVPFNPLIENIDLKLTDPFAKHHVGGYGIHLLLKTMDEVSYQRQDKSNILILRKFFSDQ